MNFRSVKEASGRAAIFCLTTVMLAACGGGGGGDSAAGVLPGPPPPGTTPPPSPDTPSSSISVGNIAASDLVASSIIGVSVASPPAITFTLEVNGYLTINDLSSANVRFSFSRLVPASEPGSLEWQSLIVTQEDPVCRSPSDVSTSFNGCTTYTTSSDPGQIPQSALKVQDPTAAGNSAIVTQATTEANGLLDRNDDGTWIYTMATDPGDPVALTDMHRVCIQFALAAPVQNPCIDFTPATIAATDDGVTGTSLEADYYSTRSSRQIVATASCTTCHDALAFHGGGRREVDYCVACHNPGSIDANSGNSVDMSVMIHRIHSGASLPSVVSGSPYKIWGFRNATHDYSDIHFPQRVANCTRCHAGEADFDSALALGRPMPTAAQTPDGHNWALQPSAAACGSCHENETHIETAGSPCAGCHRDGGLAGSVEDAHLDRVQDAARAFRFDILNVDSTAPGEFPVVDFRVVNPISGGTGYDIKNDPAFTQGGGASRLAITLAWSTADYTNTRAGAAGASTVSMNALTQSIPLGSNVFRVTSSTAIPDGTAAPFISPQGSGAVTIEGHPAADVDPRTAGVEQLPVSNAVRYFSIDEPSGIPTSRRFVVSLDQCLSCHATLSLHGSNRTDNIEGCVTCHNPRNTDRSVRAVAAVPPTDGKTEESLDFKTMIHGIHASAMRQSPLQIVGFQGFSTHVYDEEEVQFPGRLSDCTVCHVGLSYSLPLADTVLGTTVNTGMNLADPADDIVVSPTTAVCSSCHDDAVSRSHMLSSGGSFSTNQLAIDNGAVVEECEVCHRAGSIAALDSVHVLP